MSIDVLQAKIRKTKNPSMICIAPSVLELPMPIKDAARAQYGDTLRAAAESYRQFSFGILDALKDVVPAVSIVSDSSKDKRRLILCFISSSCFFQVQPRLQAVPLCRYSFGHMLSA